MKIQTAADFSGVLIAITPDLDEQDRPAIAAALLLMSKLSKSEVAMILADVVETSSDE